MNHVLILAGGSGTRLGSDTPKQFLDLAGRPVISWSMTAFERVDEIAGIVVACPVAWREKVRAIAADNRIEKIIAVTAGGETRQLSAYNALRAIDFSDDDIVLIHDAARPFVSAKMIRECFDGAREHGAAAAYVKAVDTVAELKDGFVRRIPDREALYYAQTPQAFRYGIIRRAHEEALAKGDRDASDDVRLVMIAGIEVKAVEGDYRNIKITSERDMEIAETIARGM